MDELTRRIEEIEKRNARVESDKAWEKSPIRRVSIAILTYLVICLFLYVIGEENIFVLALVPVFGFILSTISLRLIRKFFGGGRSSK
ncbi:MAG: hypothetical protein KBC17_03790 [Candidatus Pacebacteria bacterium]|nr:hypothetical protein [Candidatus Paceibacterota bacterium]